MTLPFLNEPEAGLPDPLPDDPFPEFRAWFEEAAGRREQPNPNAMYLATAGPGGGPSVRTVLCRGIDERAGWVVFYTNYTSRKGLDLESDPRAAALFHWDHPNRQVRIEGRVVRSPEPESDAYFNSRPLISRIGAWASEQSRPIRSQHELMEKAAAVIDRFGIPLEAVMSPEGDFPIPRPPHWGGYRLWAERVELWVGLEGRLHDRALWSRELVGSGAELQGGAWSATRLQP
jgi:pyridoxamine 5'-phosphate oxidase